MITHETAGDTFWDKIKAGANQAAKNNGITLKYSNDPEASKQATLIQTQSTPRSMASPPRWPLRTL